MGAKNLTQLLVLATTYFTSLALLVPLTACAKGTPTASRLSSSGSSPAHDKRAPHPLPTIAPIRPGNGPTIEVAWGALTRPWSLNVLIDELQKPSHPSSPIGSTPDIVDLPKPQWGEHPNPFNLTPRDFWVDMHLVYPNDATGPIPEIGAEDAAWFTQAVQQGKAPDVFMIGGHNVISEGFHDDSETHFLYLPTLFQAIEKFPDARKYFSQVKLALLWGCNTMTDLEPHGSQGEYLSQEQIAQIYNSGPVGRAQMVGAANQVNTLEFYKSRLAREYGPGGEHYEYTRGPRNEKCIGPGRYENCDITDLERIMPESGLFDGTRRYDNPYLMKRLFPNAYLVLGFSSASPSEETRVQILRHTLQQTYAELNRGMQPSDHRYVTNLLLEIVAPETPYPRRKWIIEALRKYWTVNTYQLNQHRPSGSITPRFPELDQNGVFNVYVSPDTPPYAPYEERGALR